MTMRIVEHDGKAITIEAIPRVGIRLTTEYMVKGQWTYQEMSVMLPMKQAKEFLDNLTLAYEEITPGAASTPC